MNNRRESETKIKFDKLSAENYLKMKLLEQDEFVLDTIEESKSNQF